MPKQTVVVVNDQGQFMRVRLTNKASYRWVSEYPDATEFQSGAAAHAYLREHRATLGEVYVVWDYGLQTEEQVSFQGARQ